MNWETQNTKGIEIDADGNMFFVKKSRSPIDADAYLQNAIRQTGWLTPALSPNTYIYFKGDNTVCIRRVTKLPFKTDVLLAKEPEGRFIYKLALNSGQGLEDAELVYTPPKGQLLLWGTVLPPPGGAPMHAYMLALSTVSSRMYHPALPNVHGDGKLCTGALNIEYYREERGIEKYLNDFYNAWAANTWNGDLAGTHGTNPAMWLRFNPDTKQNILPDDVDENDPAGWEKYGGAGPVVPPGLYDEALHAVRTRILGREV